MLLSKTILPWIFQAVSRLLFRRRPILSMLLQTSLLSDMCRLREKVRAFSCPSKDRKSSGVETVARSLSCFRIIRKLTGYIYLVQVRSCQKRLLSQEQSMWKLQGLLISDPVYARTRSALKLPALHAFQERLQHPFWMLSLPELPVQSCAARQTCVSCQFQEPHP